MNKPRNRSLMMVVITLMMLVLVAGALHSLAAAAGPAAQGAAQAPYRADQAELRAQAEATGRAPVIVGLSLPAYTPQAMAAGGDEALGLQTMIAQEQQGLLARLSSHQVDNVKQYEYIPFMALSVDAAGLDALYADPQVTSIEEDRLEAPLLDDSVPLVRAHFAHYIFYDGSSQAVAVLDTGVDKTHDDLSGRVISEACYSTESPIQNTRSLCPGGSNSSTAPGSGLDCAAGISGCDHGTHVAGIAAGTATDADLISIQVFSRVDDVTGNTPCANAGRTSPCTLSYVSDQVAALNRVYALRNTFNIAAVNMSLGAGQNISTCDSTESARKTIIDALRNTNIVTVIAAGNSGFVNALGSPACISTAISVGATDMNDAVANFSNAAGFMTLWAPGANIDSTVPNNATQPKNGTSMAAPHVAGAVAVLKEANPNLSAAQIVSLLTSNGPNVTDQRTTSPVTKRRLDVYGALCDIITCDGDDFRTLSLNVSRAGLISPSLDRDHYFYNGAAGEQVTIEMDRTSGTLDPYLELYDPNGNRVALNNNGGAGNNARINGYTLQHNGRYQIVARSYSGSGGYNVKVSHNVVTLNPAPYISTLSPRSATGTFTGSSFWARIYGQNFMPQSQVLLNGSYRPMYYSHSNLIWIWVYGSDLGLPWPRTSIVHVRNPAPGGGYSNPGYLSITSPFLGISELVTPTAGSNINSGIATTFAISWTHPISSWREMQNMDLILRDEHNQTAAWVRLTEGDPDSTLKLLNPAEDGTPVGEGLPGEPLDLVISDTVTLHLDESSMFGSGMTVIMSPTLTFGPEAVGTYNIEFRVDNAEGEVQADDVLGQLTIAPPGCDAPVSEVVVDGPSTAMSGASYNYTALLTPTAATAPISYTWTPEPDSGQGTAVATYNWTDAGEKVVMVNAENCGAFFAAGVQVTQVATTGAPDLGISKSGPAVALAGQPITYTLALSNSGAQTATNVTVVDTMPHGASYVSGGVLVGDTVTWNLGDLSGYGTVTETQFAVTANDTITNSSYGVTASGGYGDNGSAVVTTRIVDALLTVTPTMTGTLQYGAGSSLAEITVPAGALFETTTLVYEELDGAGQAPVASNAARAFLFEAYQSNEKVDGLTFGEAVTIQLGYRDEDVAGLNEQNLTLAYRDADGWSSAGVSCQTDAIAKRVTCQLQDAPAGAYRLTASWNLFLPSILGGKETAFHPVPALRPAGSELVAPSGP